MNAFGILIAGFVGYLTGYFLTVKLLSWLDATDGVALDDEERNEILHMSVWWVIILPFALIVAICTLVAKVAKRIMDSSEDDNDD